MAQKSFPWTGNGTGDGTSGGYTALEWGEIWRQMFLGGSEASQGVCKGVANELAVTGTASPLSINTGAAVVYGKFFQNTASTTVTVTTPVVGTTGGHVILRLDWVAQTVRLVAVRNTDGVNSTPSLTQSTSTQWEIRLASFTITTGGVITVTDARAYVHMSQLVATANIDDLAVTTGKLAANAVTAGKLATDSVDDTIVGNRVPQFYRRQGGNSSDWSIGGTTDYTPTAVRMQAGSVAVAAPAGRTVTFPVAFSQPPIVLVGNAVNSSRIYRLSSITASGFTVTSFDDSGAAVDGSISWLAIGPE